MLEFSWYKKQIQQKKPAAKAAGKNHRFTPTNGGHKSV